jgi:Methyltransferase domain
MEPSVIPILDQINELQRDTIGNVVEIGVHYGKFFLFLAERLKHDECAFAVDIFENQDENISKSGWGSLATFSSNVAALVPSARVCILKENSTNLRDKIGLFSYNGHTARIVSVDAGHSYEEVTSDLKLAEDILHPQGVIIVDDFQHLGWDGVYQATLEFLQGPFFMPFALGGNKLLLCRSEFVYHYAANITSMTQQEYLATVIDPPTRNKVMPLLEKHNHLVLFKEQQHLTYENQ